MRLKLPEWLALSDIPNQAGFQLLVLKKDGTQQKTKVRRCNETGFHSLIDCRISDSVGWKQILTK